MFKILVTGSSGFVGEELIDKLTKSNYSVIGIDNFEPSDLEKKKYELKNFFFEKADIRNNLKNLDKIFKKKNSFRGKIGIFDIKNNKINHRLNFYKIENQQIIKIF